MKQPPEELLRPFVIEGKKAKKRGMSRGDCPYSMGNALTGGGVQLQIFARDAWMKGFTGGVEEPLRILAEVQKRL